MEFNCAHCGALAERERQGRYTDMGTFKIRPVAA